MLYFLYQVFEILCVIYTYDTVCSAYLSFFIWKIEMTTESLRGFLQGLGELMYVNHTPGLCVIYMHHRSKCCIIIQVGVVLLSSLIST